MGGLGLILAVVGCSLEDKIKKEEPIAEISIEREVPQNLDDYLAKAKPHEEKTRKLLCSRLGDVSELEKFLDKIDLNDNTLINAEIAARKDYDDFFVLLNYIVQGDIEFVKKSSLLENYKKNKFFYRNFACSIEDFREMDDKKMRYLGKVFHKYERLRIELIYLGIEEMSKQAGTDKQPHVYTGLERGFIIYKEKKKLARFRLKLDLKLHKEKKPKEEPPIEYPGPERYLYETKRLS